MTQPLPAAEPFEASTLGTRFGPISIQPERVITFRYGVFGFAEHTRFVLTDVPARNVPFKVLHSVGEPEVGFLVLPLDPSDGPIEPHDLDLACQHLGFSRDGLVVLGIVTLRAAPGIAPGHINLKAPVLIDSARMTGCQYVLADERYDLQHPLPIS